MIPLLAALLVLAVGAAEVAAYIAHRTPPRPARVHIVLAHYRAPRSHR